MQVFISAVPRAPPGFNRGRRPTYSAASSTLYSDSNAKDATRLKETAGDGTRQPVFSPLSKDDKAPENAEGVPITPASGISPRPDTTTPVQPEHTEDVEADNNPEDGWLDGETDWGPRRNLGPEMDQIPEGDEDYVEEDESNKNDGDDNEDDNAMKAKLTEQLESLIKKSAEDAIATRKTVHSISATKALLKEYETAGPSRRKEHRPAVPDPLLEAAEAAIAAAAATPLGESNFQEELYKLLPKPYHHIRWKEDADLTRHITEVRELIATEVQPGGDGPTAEERNIALLEESLLVYKGPVLHAYLGLKDTVKAAAPGLLNNVLTFTDLILQTVQEQQ